MEYNYKDLTYIRAALQSYEAELCSTSEDECSEDDFSEIQDDIPYISRLITITDNYIKDFESVSPKPKSI